MRQILAFLFLLTIALGASSPALAQHAEKAADPTQNQSARLDQLIGRLKESRSAQDMIIDEYKGNPIAITKLKRCLGGPDEELRVRAACALWNVTGSGKEALPVLERVLNSTKRVEIKNTILLEFCMVRTADDEEWKKERKVMTPIVRAQLKDEQTCPEALAAFSWLAGEDRPEEVTGWLLKTLKESKNEHCRRAAIRQMAYYSGHKKALVPALLDALKDTSQDCRREVVRSLECVTFPGKDEAVRAALVDRLRHDQSSCVRADAADCLRSIFADAKLVEPLISALQDKSPRVREEVAKSLGRIHKHDTHNEIAPKLRDLLKDSDPSVQVAAAATLWSIKQYPKEASEVVVRRLHSDEHPMLTYLRISMVVEDESLIPKEVRDAAEKAHIPNLGRLMPKIQVVDK